VTRATAHLVRAWYAPRPTPLAQALRPLSWTFGALARARRALYGKGVLRSTRLPVPVVVVGNITVGGTGKTPLVVALVDALRARGRRPGIVSRGYGRGSHDVREVRADARVDAVGDEPLILAATGAPTWVGADRASAAQALLRAHRDVDVIVADDGLQHYALARDVEIAVVDAVRALGNALLLPAGPLREPPSRLASVAAVVRVRSDTGAVDAQNAFETPAGVRQFEVVHEPQRFVNLVDPSRILAPDVLRDPSTVAIAGIGDPERFFGTLRARGFVGAMHAFADHHQYAQSDVAFPGARAVLMTEKDAVKCRAFEDARMWMLPIRARFDSSLTDFIMERIDGSEAARNSGLSGDQRAADP
jgi:tetraacyldisaccharide 4'-kinase